MPTDPNSGAAVRRLYEALREALARRPEAARREVMVSEIYQSLVPYARARSELGFEMNADYEHALMRLLAGEGGYARLQQPEARALVARELESGNPDVTMYRKFAASTLVLGEPIPASATSRAPRADIALGAPRSAATTSRPEGAPPTSLPAAAAPTSPLPAAAPTSPLAAAAPPAASPVTAQRAAPAVGGEAREAGDVSWRQALDRIARESPATDLEEETGRALEDGLARLSSVMHAGATAGGAAPAAPSPGRSRDLAAGPGTASTQGEPTAPPVRAPQAAASAPATRPPPDARNASRPEAVPGDLEPLHSRAAARPEPATASAPDEVDEADTSDGREAVADCGSCGKTLPGDREVRFCPYCGSEQPRICAGCGDSLEADWRFCPSCGSEA